MRREVTRKERARSIRDAVIAHLFGAVRQADHRYHLDIGDFRIGYLPPGAIPGWAFHTLDIWPDGRIDSGHMMYGNKVCSFAWDRRGEITLTSFRSGEWEERLLQLLGKGQEWRELGEMWLFLAEEAVIEAGRQSGATPIADSLWPRHVDAR